MNEIVLVAMIYLVIVLALLHTSYSLGVKPTLQVVYRLNDVDNKNELECFANGFRRSEATFTFKEPGTEAVEKNVTKGRFTIHPSNESLVTCTVDSEESDPVMVAAIPQYTADVTGISQYNYLGTAVVDVECPLQLGRLKELYMFSWGAVRGGFLPISVNGTQGLYWLAEENNRTLHVNISAGSQRNFQCVGAVQTCHDSTSPCTTVRRNSPTITIMKIDHPIVNVSITPEAISRQSRATFICTSNWTDIQFSSNPMVEWMVDNVRYNDSTCEQQATFCKITRSLSDDSLSQTAKLYAFIDTTEHSVTVMCEINFNGGVTEVRLPFATVDQRDVQFVCTELSPLEGSGVTVNYTMKSIGSSAEYQCRSSHLQLSTSNTSAVYTRNCTNRGWSGEEPVCICRELEFEGGSISYPGSRHIGSVVTYTCNGSKTDSKFMGNRTCNATIGWDGEEPKCKCLTSPEGGTLDLNDFLFVESQATYACENSDGLVLRATVNCLSNGRWDRGPLICSCTELPDPTVQYSMNRSVGSYATYKDFKCGVGYELSGNTNRTCSGSGWDGVDPTCKLTTVTTVIISVLATFIAVIVVLGVIYFLETLYKRKRKSRRELMYDVPYAYELPPLPPRPLRRNSGIYDTISNGSNDDPQNQSQTVVDNNNNNFSSRSPDRVAFVDSEVPTVLSCTATLNNPPLCDENDAENTVNNECPPASPVEAVISTRPSTELDLCSERANETEPPLNLEVGEITELEESTGVEDQIDEPWLRIPRINVTANVSYQPSTHFHFERNPAYRTNVAIAPEIETSENVAYEHCESHNINMASSLRDTQSTNY